MAKDPAFLFYSADFMMGAMLLSMEERGQYITLLSVMHQQGRLTGEEVEVVIKGKPSQRLSSKFKISESGQWFSERLEEEITKRKKFTESRRNSLNIDNDDMVHIYLLFDPTTNNYKIGSSKYPLLRLTDARKRSPEITLFWRSDNLVIRENEKFLHDEFSEKKVRHDWFALNDNDINTIISKEIFRTKHTNILRTEPRTVNENVNVNKDIIEYGLKKEYQISIKKVYATDKIKIIYDLQTYFSKSIDQLERAGWTRFDDFMKANPARVFDDDDHLYHAFKKFHEGKNSGKQKIKYEDVA